MDAGKNGQAVHLVIPLSRSEAFHFSTTTQSHRRAMIFSGFGQKNYK
jgi:hypothetical protein